MDEIQVQLEQELRLALGRLRQLGGAIMIEDSPGPVCDDASFGDSMDRMRANEDREISLATRSLLVERANRLAEALERLRKGVYGLCEECGEPIPRARLKAMPEVTTCVRCQDRIEREFRRPDTVGILLDTAEDDG